MNFKMLPIVALTALALSACKIKVVVPEGGQVVSASGTYTCSAGNTCTIEVNDFLFDEIFTAQPAQDYVFSHWADAQEGGFFCGTTTGTCKLRSAPSANNAFLKKQIEGNASYNLQPVFVPAPCDLSGVNTNSNTNVMRNNGLSSNVFNNPDQPLNQVAVRNANCGGGGDAYGACNSPGSSTGARIWACSVLHELVVNDTSEVELDRAVVLDMMRLYNGAEVLVSAGEVNEVETWGHSHLVVKAGEIGPIHALETSEVTIQGGVVRDLEAIDSAELRVTGGRVNEITAFDQGKILVEGGDLRIIDGNQSPYAGYLEAQGLGQITWSGGRTVPGEVGDRTNGNLILTFGSAEIVIIGTKFTWSNASGSIVDQPLDYGKLPATVGWLSGKLANGSPLRDVFWEQKAGSQIVLAAPIQ
ncbi:hypothetical protein [Haliea sp. E17]|uniref:hypothetical protein n=1 Tax=Haliea sp. E17 TaxID=3401576 RepID=UPI003AABF1E0